MTNIKGIQQWKILNNKIEAVLGEFRVGDVEDLEVPELGQGDHHTKFVAVHERGIGDIEKS